MNSFKIKFEHNKHKRYFLYILKGLPSSMGGLDTQRIILAYFSISGLDVLNELDSITNKQAIIDWIYTLQIIDESELVSGFQNSSTLNTESNRHRNALYKWGHIASTYSAIATLIILGDDLQRINRLAIIRSLRELQLENGCYKGAKEGTEHDMRFIYCAACICYMLNDWSGMDVDKTTDFILNSMSYDCGIGQQPALESHSGSTFCAVAALSLMGRLRALATTQRAGLVRWLLNRFDAGFNGRPNKPTDTCYAFWTGGALRILDAYRFIEAPGNEQLVLVAQGRKGGFSKWPNTEPDPLHTYLGLAGLSFMRQEGLQEVYPELNITVRAREHLLEVHKKWRM